MGPTLSDKGSARLGIARLFGPPGGSKKRSARPGRDELGVWDKLLAQLDCYASLVFSRSREWRGAPAAKRSCASTARGRYLYLSFDTNGASYFYHVISTGASSTA